MALWQNLLDYDKQRVVFAARHQDRLKTGRFRSSKYKADFTPGVESLKRCALTTSAPLAQWPDCSRLIEAIIVRLCGIHKSPKKQGKGTVTRWTLILQDYRKIRQLILTNGAIMQDTNLQLVEVNQTTLIQWHNRRVKMQDTSLVLQGIDLPSRLSVAAESLLPGSVRPTVAHIYNLPPTTIGQAVTKRRATATVTSAPVAVRPKLPAQRQLFPKPLRSTADPSQICSPATSVFLGATPHFPSSPLITSAPFPVSTQAPVVFAVPRAPTITPSSSAPLASSTPRRAAPKTYQRKVEANCWRKCGQHRTAETGHSQYRGKIYCPSSETLSKEQWLEEMREKVGAP